MRRVSRFAVALAALGASCLVATARAEQTRAPTVASAPVRVETVAKGLVFPWGLQFLPDGRFLITERPGRLRVVLPDGVVLPAVTGLPDVAATGQGGLLDVALAPDFASSGLVYLAYAEPRGGNRNGTSVARGRLNLTSAPPSLTDVQVIFRQQPDSAGGLHFGARLVFAPDGRLYVSLGERFQMEGAQDLGRHWGKVVRIEADGRVPADNPFTRQPGARPEIWSLGHRNPQAAALHPSSGQLWVIEHGPQGGDEINIVRRGRNYGWPVIGYGIDYSGAPLHASTHRDGMEQPIYYWRPSIAPSGMAFYRGRQFPGWEGSLLVGALAGRALHRLVLNGDVVAGEEVLLKDLGERIRDVRVDAAGGVFLLTDSADGRVLRLSPAQP